MKKSVILLFVCLFFVPVFSQENIKINYKAETFGSLASGNNTPFWMLFHNWGVVPFNSTNFYLRGAAFGNHKINNDWSYNVGLDIIGSSPHEFSTIWIQQFYGELNRKSLQLRIGTKEDYTSFLDEHLSSGDMNISNNARPVPEITMRLNKFVPIPFTGEHVFVKGDFSVGKFSDGKWMENKALPHGRSYAKDVLLHHKSIYFRVGDIEKPNDIQVTVGLKHFVQWGGVLYWYAPNQTQYIVTDQPHQLQDFIRVIFAQKGREGSSGADKANVAGSHSGNNLLKVDYKLKNDDRLEAYYQHFFEDGSSMNPRSFMDMLLGIQYKSGEKQLVSNILFEYIYTKNQAGSIHFVTPAPGDEQHAHLENKETGNDDYYNNVDYIQGPSHFGRSMGTSLFLSPEFNRDHYLNFKSNRIIAFHLGLEGYILPPLQYRLLLTTGQSMGRYYMPFIKEKTGFASLLELMYSDSRFSDFDFKLSLGYNQGEFFGANSFGGGLTIIKKGIIYSK
ncbi:MAG: capsule assembly Wzi family protein [Dysgonamonadaceae bacterium]|jgi:hypothetical protein|nr:capsule assembly Wzi family protein [Dysgonamonadaceae bacterium]